MSHKDKYIELVESQMELENELLYQLHMQSIRETELLDSQATLYQSYLAIQKNFIGVVQEATRPFAIFRRKKHLEDMTRVLSDSTKAYSAFAKTLRASIEVRHDADVSYHKKVLEVMKDWRDYNLSIRSSGKQSTDHNPNRERSIAQLVDEFDPLINVITDPQLKAEAEEMKDRKIREVLQYLSRYRVIEGGDKS